MATVQPTDEPENPRQAVLDALLAERYRKSVWWKRPADHPELDLDDSDIATARRRRVLADADKPSPASHRRWRSA